MGNLTELAGLLFFYTGGIELGLDKFSGCVWLGFAKVVFVWSAFV